MDGEKKETWEIAVLILAILAVTLVTSVGFASLSDNPLVPETTFELSDAEDRYDLSQPGTVGFFIIKHVSGDPIEFSKIEIIIGGSRTGGAVLTPENNWTDESGELTYRARTPDGAIPNSSKFGQGDRLIVSKIKGTIDLQGPLKVRIRLYHRPSQRRILDRRVAVR